MATGPVQMLVVGFEDPKFEGEVLAELERLKAADMIRLIDLLVVQKQENGEVETLQRSDLSKEQSETLGAIVGALIGYGEGGDEGAEAGAAAGMAAMQDGHVFSEEQVWYVQDVLPPGSAAAIALLEHRWAIGLRDAIRRAGGMLLADEWVHPADLVAVGIMAADEIEREAA